MSSMNDTCKLYVATFNRAPDAAGLAYWVYDSGLTIEQIAQSFFDQPETQSTYPAGTSNSLFVTSIYMNLFNRAPDVAGLTYWVEELDKGSLSKDVMILAVINGALDTEVSQDATILANKQTTGLAFAAEGLNNTTLAADIMSNVDASVESVNTALKIIDQSISNITVASSNSSGQIGNSNSYLPHISSDGHYAVFWSNATNLTQEETIDNDYDIYRKDLLTGEIVKIDVVSAFSGVGGPYESGAAISLSANGKYAAFTRYDYMTNSSADHQVYLADFESNTSTIISTNNVGEYANDISLYPSLSSDGSFIVFQSNATNMLYTDYSPRSSSSSVYLKNLQSGEVTKFLEDTTAGLAKISEDGNMIVFQSSFAHTGSYANQAVYIKNLTTDNITKVSESSDGASANYVVYPKDISSDGRYVIMTSMASNLVAHDTNRKSDIFMKDTQTGTMIRISEGSNGEESDTDSYNGSVSADGKYVVFESSSNNLVAGDNNSNVNVFLKDTIAGELILISKNEAGEACGGYDAEITSDGKYIIYQSNSSNLVDIDTNGQQIFIVGNPLIDQYPIM